MSGITRSQCVFTICQSNSFTCTASNSKAAVNGTVKTPMQGKGTVFVMNAETVEIGCSLTLLSSLIHLAHSSDTKFSVGLKKMKSHIASLPIQFHRAQPNGYAVEVEMWDMIIITVETSYSNSIYSTVTNLSRT